MELNRSKQSNSKYEQAYCDEMDELSFEQPVKLAPAVLNAEETRIISKAAEQLRLQESLRVAKIESKRVFITDCKSWSSCEILSERMTDQRPISFEVDRGDGERVQILYSVPPQDRFY